jgi:hypothetical protein
MDTRCYQTSAGVDFQSATGHTRSPYFVHRECRRCRRNRSRRVGLVAAFAGLVGDEPTVTGARATFPNFPNRMVVAGCLVVVALRRCRHGGERGRAAGEAASDDALNLSHFLKCDRCKNLTLFLQERQRRYVVETGKDALQLLAWIGRQMLWGGRQDGCWLCRPTDQDSNVESKECLAFFRMLVF